MLITGEKSVGAIVTRPWDVAAAGLEAVDELGLREGATVTAVVKASDVMIAVHD